MQCKRQPCCPLSMALNGRCGSPAACSPGRHTGCPQSAASCTAQTCMHLMWSVSLQLQPCPGHHDPRQRGGMPTRRHRAQSAPPAPAGALTASLKNWMIHVAH